MSSFSTWWCFVCLMYFCCRSLADDEQIKITIQEHVPQKYAYVPEGKEEVVYIPEEAPHDVEIEVYVPDENTNDPNVNIDVEIETINLKTSYSVENKLENKEEYIPMKYDYDPTIKRDLPLRKIQHLCRKQFLNISDQICPHKRRRHKRKHRKRSEIIIPDDDEEDDERDEEEDNSAINTLYQNFIEENDNASLVRFAEKVQNVTVAVGRDARLDCVVEHLQHHRVAWLRVETKTILTIHRNVISRNYRIHLSHTDDRVWTLIIKNVQEEDEGQYMCQLNTVPMRAQIGILTVVVPPDIVDTESSSDVAVREGTDVNMRCKAKGIPEPVIQWRREDAMPFAAGHWRDNKQHLKEMSMSEDVRAKKNITGHVDGDTLTIHKVSRLHMGAYLCIASNGVPPAVSRRISLSVHFQPMIWIPDQLVGCPVNGKVTLKCFSEAYPTSINYWTREDKSHVVIDSRDNYTLSLKVYNAYKMQMMLTIHRVQPSDFGTYKCYSKNSLGETEGSIRLYEVHHPHVVKGPLSAKIQRLDGASGGEGGGIWPTESGTNMSHSTTTYPPPVMDEMVDRSVCPFLSGWLLLLLLITIGI